jgi:hypothetical protein
MNFSKPNWKLVVGLTCACIVACIACIAIVSYVFLFYCKKTMDDYAIFFNDHNAQSKKVIDSYGDFRITRAYIVTTPITTFTLFLLNVITMQNCKHLIDDTMHVRLLIECKSNKHEKKLIMIDKTNCINVMTDFHIDDACRIITIKLKKKTTLRGILDETCARVGKMKFFNWHIYKNNCHYFTKELIYQINDEFSCKYFKSKKKIKQFCNKMFYNNFILHLYHIMLFLHNFFQKYILNVKEHIVSKMECMNAR